MTQHRNGRIFSAIGVFAAVGCCASIALADPPPGYYDTITGTTGATIKPQLTALTNQAIFRSYDAAAILLQDIDEDPENPANILLVYTGASINSAWTAGATWNREHSWPRSLGVGTSGDDNSDLHMLWPCNPSINSSRGNKPFGTAPGSWDPDQFGATYRGRMARGMFYANTRYTYLNMAVIGSQPELIDWHFQQMPDEYDRRRNDGVYTAQQNRNPFVDHPEWVWAVYGDGPSDAQITVSGASVVDGGSWLSVDLGLVIDRPGTTDYSFDLAKTGAAPVTYTISTGGDAESAMASPFALGFARNTQGLPVSVSLLGGPGVRTGTVTIDNTDITNAGVGFGAADGDDVVTIDAVVLEPSLASFDAAAVVDIITVDLGIVSLGDADPMESVLVHNLTDGLWGAQLDLDSLSVVAGDAAAFAVDMPLASVVAPGASEAIEIRLVTTTTGLFEAHALLTVSDEDLPGEASALLELTLRGRVTAACLADVNGSGAVEPGDFVAWVAAYNADDIAADQNLDGLVGPSDFVAWVSNYNAGCP